MNTEKAFFALKQDYKLFQIHIKTELQRFCKMTEQKPPDKDETVYVNWNLHRVNPIYKDKILLYTWDDQFDEEKQSWAIPFVFFTDPVKYQTNLEKQKQEKQKNAQENHQEALWQEYLSLQKEFGGKV